MKPSALRFFFVVARPGNDALIVALIVFGFGLYLASINPGGFDQIFGLAIVFQLFAASTGYRDRLRRGHFDPILAGRTSRWLIAAAHWAVSAGLGLIVWTALTLLELAVHPERVPTAVAPDQIAAFLYASTAAWALTVPFPRYSGGLLWLLSLFILGMTQQVQTLRVTFTPVPDTWLEALRSAGDIFVIPFLLMINPATANFKLLTVVVAGTALAWLAGAALIDQFEAALVED